MSQQNDLADQQLIQAGYRYALALTHHQQEAEDLVQHACLKALRSRGTLVSKPYMFFAIRHLFYDAAEKQQAVPIDREAVELIATDSVNFEEGVDNRLDLEKLLSVLTTDQREAIYLNCVEGYTAAEIAKMTDRPRGTVLSLLSRAKQKLIDRTTPSTIGEDVR